MTAESYQTAIPLRRMKWSLIKAAAQEDMLGMMVIRICRRAAVIVVLKCCCCCYLLNVSLSC